MSSKQIRFALLGCAIGLASGSAFAQETIPDPNPQERTQIGEGEPRNSTALPPPRSDHDPQPQVPAPTIPETGVTKQSGVGGTQAYGRAGVLELGGSGGFAAASNYSRFELSPSVGLFLVDNVELSLLTGFNYFRIGEMNGNPSTHATELKALIEPSFHLPFSQVAFGFLGLGAGVSYITGADAGFALQPRLGANFLVGRSGVLTPSLTVAYSTTDAIRTPVGTILAVRTSYGMNIGYTVMW
jgi:hypothetical protein